MVFNQLLPLYIHCGSISEVWFHAVHMYHSCLPILCHGGDQGVVKLLYQPVRLWIVWGGSCLVDAKNATHFLEHL